ncbi:MAG: hypothetical protein AAF533_12605 [Acidobacteriota bacterium]
MLAVVLLLLAWTAAPSQAVFEPTQLTFDNVDGNPTGIIDLDGQLLLAFDRRTVSGTDSGIVFMTSADGRTFGDVEVLIDLPLTREAEPALLRSELVLWCYFVSNITGTDRIHVAQREAGGTWQLGPRPLDLGFEGMNLGHPSIVSLPGDFGSAVLAFDVDERGEHQVYIQELSGFLSPVGLPVSLGSGQRPNLLRDLDGRLLIAREPDDVLVGTLVNVSLDGLAWSADIPTIAEEVVGAPHLVQLPSGAISLMAEAADAPAFFRSFESVAASFGRLRELPTGDAPLSQPYTAVLESGEALTYGVMAGEDLGSGETHVVLTEVGTCDEPALFGGLNEIIDTIPCDPEGLELSWVEPLSWGSGTTGTYEILRSPSPDFPEGMVELIDTTDLLSYTVPAAPGGPYWYRVRARATETCWLDETDTTLAQGRIDENTATLEGIDMVGTEPPAAASGLTLSGSATLGLLNWSEQADAEAYRIYVSDQPDGGFVDLLDRAVVPPQMVPFDDAPIVFFRIRAESPCEVLGP